MKKLIKLMLAVILTLTSIAATAQQDNKAYINQDATAEREVVPDELYLSITINEKDNKGKVTLETQQNKMIDTLKSLGIDVEKNLAINFMGSQISYSAFKRNINPRTQAVYTLKLTDAVTMQKVISLLEADDITNIQLTKTKYSRADELCRELGAEAVKKAKAEATILAEAIGQSIGPAIYINSWKSQTGNPQPRMYKAARVIVEEANDAVTANEPQIEVGKITFSVNVNIRFLLNE